MKKSYLIVFVFFMFFSSALQAGTVIIDSIYSDTLGKTLYYMVVLPDNYQERVQQGKRFPVLYLLHCLGCDYYSWTQYSYGARVDAFIDSVSYIIAAPSDGNNASWWLDSPKKNDFHFSTFLIREFKPMVDARFVTLPDRENTGIAGHSMGGFGAFHNLIEHPDIFGVAFSIKGAFDPSLPPNPNWPGDFHFGDLLGTDSVDLPNWDRVNVLKNIHRIKDRGVKIGFYTGTNDVWFHPENVRLHVILDSMAIPHRFDSTDEDHASIPFEQMNYVMKYFDTSFTGYPAQVRPGRSMVQSAGGNCRRRYVTINGKTIDPAQAYGQVILEVREQDNLFPRKRITRRIAVIR